MLSDSLAFVPEGLKGAGSAHEADRPLHAVMLMGFSHLFSP